MCIATYIHMFATADDKARRYDLLSIDSPQDK